MRTVGFNRVLITRMKKVNKKRKKYCMFFCRYGRCLNSKCPYVHDVDKVAVCTRFLRGKCRINGCLFSHKVEPEKMPVCSFFLRGRCNNDSCPYVHVNVNPEASICKDFLNGFCEKAQQCKLRHVFMRRTKANSSKSESVLGTNSAISERKKLFKKRSVKKQPPSKKTIAENECENNSENSATFPGFIPLVKDTRAVDSDDVDFADNCHEFLPNKEWSTLDYDSDDTWIDEEECQSENQAKKPSIRIIPHFLMDTSV